MSSTATYDDDPTDDLRLDHMWESDEVKIAEVKGGVEDYVAVKLNARVNNKVKRL